MLKPVDLQTIMPRSFDLQKGQQVNNTRYITEQQEMAKQVIQESQQRKEQVQQGDPSSEGNRIRDDQQPQERKDRKYRRFASASKKQANEADEGLIPDTGRGSVIDIKI